MSITKRNRAYFFSSSTGTSSRLFRQHNRPDENAFRNLLKSVLLFNESDDTATEDDPGHVKIATSDNVLNRVNQEDGHNKAVSPSKLPHIGTSTSFCVPFDPEREESANGIKVLELQNNRLESSGSDFRIKYIIQLLYDAGIFEINGSGELTLTDEIKEILDYAEGIKDGGLTSEDFDISMFGSGIENNGSGGIRVAIDSNDFEFDSGNLKIKNQAITLARLQDLGAGQIIVGQDGGGTPVLATLTGEGNILIGTATGVAVVSLPDLISAITIEDSSIKARKIDASTLGDGLKRDSANSDTSKLHVDITTDCSLTFEEGKLQLNGDVTTDPGNYYSYGVQEGVRGFYKNELDPNEVHFFNQELVQRAKVHGFYAVEDATELIDLTENIWAHVTNGTNDLFSAIQTDAGFILVDDKFKFNRDAITDYRAHITIDFQIVLTGGNNKNIEVRMYNITRDAHVPIKASGRTNSAGYLTLSGRAYEMYGDFDDEFKIEVRNTTDSTDVTVTDCGVFLEVNHYIQLG